MSKLNISTHSIQSSSTDAGVIDVHVFGCSSTSTSPSPSIPIRGTIVTVHPWATLGGSENNTIGLARRITCSKLKGGEDNHRWRVITFTLQSTPIWKGGALWGICSAHSYEVQQIVDVVNWVSKTYGIDQTIVLLGSSAGAPMAGSAMAEISKQPQSKVAAYIAVGYTFGRLASLGFYRHYAPVLSASLPKLFIMGERDEFTSVEQLYDMVQKMKSNGDDNVVDVEIVADVGHFELESPSYDPLVCKLAIEWLDKVLSLS